MLETGWWRSTRTAREEDVRLRRQAPCAARGRMVGRSGAGNRLRALDQREGAIRVSGAALGHTPTAWSLNAGPATSQWIQGTRPTNSRRKRAAVIPAPQRSPVCLMSATSLLRVSRSSSKRQTPEGFTGVFGGTRELSREFCQQCRRSEQSLPNATTQAPVSVAASTIRSGSNLLA